MPVSRVRVCVVLLLIASTPASDIKGQALQGPQGHPSQVTRKPMDAQGLFLARTHGRESRGLQEPSKAAGGEKTPDYRYPRIPPKPEPTPWERLKAWFSHKIHVPPEAILISPGFISLMTLLSFGIVYFIVFRR
ncbi:MAG: hypothetical protein ACE5NA_10125 [Nitrospiraceae bacterium]